VQLCKITCTKFTNTAFKPGQHQLPYHSQQTDRQTDEQSQYNSSLTLQTAAKAQTASK